MKFLKKISSDSPLSCRCADYTMRYLLNPFAMKFIVIGIPFSKQHTSLWRVAFLWYWRRCYVWTLHYCLVVFWFRQSKPPTPHIITTKKIFAEFSKPNKIGKMVERFPHIIESLIIFIHYTHFTFINLNSILPSYLTYTCANVYTQI